MTKKEILEKAELSLNKIRPHLVVDGGNIEIIDFTGDQVLLVKLLGNCSNCDMSAMTLKAGVEEIIQRDIPEILSIKAV